MKIFFDTEFIEDGSTIDLLSIGLVREDGAELYRENSDATWSKADVWVCDNVLKKLEAWPKHQLPLVAPPPRPETQNADTDYGLEMSAFVSHRELRAPPHDAHLKHWRTREEIAIEVRAFAGPDPEFWAYYADYDWVVLCQLYGRMIDLPEGWPMYCRDLKQEMDRLGVSKSDLPPNDNAHNALDDARWNRDVFCRMRASKNLTAAFRAGGQW